MIVYHGSIEIVKNPDVNHSFRPLDFGMGFYVTTVKIAFITQKAIDQLLTFDSYYEV